MQEQWTIGRGLGWYGRDKTASEWNQNRLDGCSQSHRIPVVLVNYPGTEAHGMEIQVLRNRMMVVLGSRRALVFGTFDRSMGMVGMRMVLRMRLGMKDIGVYMRRDLKQVRQSQDQDYTRPEYKRESRQ